MSASLLWFRQDLRLQDNEALRAAIKRGAPLIPCYILDDAGEGNWKMGAASRSWLHRSLAALDGALQARGSRLVLARGDTATVLRRICAQTGADTVYWTRRYEPAVAQRDRRLAAELQAAGITVVETGGALLFEPTQVKNRQGGPFQVFTPFWRMVRELGVPPPVALPAGRWPAPRMWPASIALAELGLQPAPAWDAGFFPPWEPGEAGAEKRLRALVRGRLDDYGERRDIPAVEGTSLLSPHLHFGEVSPRRIWQAVHDACTGTHGCLLTAGANKFLAEIGWREFAHHVLSHFPHTPERPLRENFAAFPWAKDPGGKRWRAWRRGETGYPIIDAGMRQLWRTGWMHNRVRMISASFLVKHLRLPWQEGASYFWDTLVDADLASNTLNWQWSAGCGADAAPYFRIFAPVTQSMKFDPDGDYIRRWVPELAAVPPEAIHAPWESSALLTSVGVTLGRDYPQPIVDHATARAEALAAFKSLRA